MLIPAGEIIRRSIALYKENTHTFIKYMIALFVPMSIITIIGTVNDPSLGYAIPSLLFPIFFVGIVCSFFAMLWFSLAFLRVVARRYEHQPVGSLKQEIESTKSSIWPCLWVSILGGIIILAGMVLFIIPGIIFNVWYYFSTYEVLLHNKKGMQALSESKQLVKGRWWGVFWRLLLPGAVFILIGSLAQAFVVIPLDFFSSQTLLGLIITMFFLLLSNAAMLLCTPLLTAAPTILYLELKKTPGEVAVNKSKS